EDMYSRFSTPLICCSIGVTTVEATTSALAPGYWPDTLMIGGAISGYCATGRRTNATVPRITNTIETTAAKIGRSMKKCEMRIRAASALFVADLRPRRLGRGRAPLLLRLHLDARARAHQAVDHHPVVAGNAVLDDAQVARQLRGRDVSLPHHVLAVDHQHVLARLLGADRRVGHEQRRVGRRGRHPHAAEHAGGEHP